MTHNDQINGNQDESEQKITRRTVLASSGIVLTSGLAGCSETGSPGTGTNTRTSTTPPADSVFEEIEFEGSNLVVTLASEHNVTRLNLIAPDGSTFKQVDVAEGATTVRIQILFKAGESYTAGQYELVAVTGESSVSMSLTLQPDLRIVDVQPEQSGDDQQSTGRLLVTVANTGTGPTWVYNIGYRNAPYPNAPQVIEGDSVVNTTFERPEDPKQEFLTPDTQQIFLKERPVIVISDSDQVSCQGGTLEMSVVVQTPHGDVQQRIRAHLSGGYNVEDPAAIQHPCKHVEIELIEDGGANG